MKTILECLPLGIGQNGEGVCLDLRLGEYHFLLDCGLKDPSLLRQLAQTQKWVGAFCSHAHADHSRSLSSLQAIAPDIPIFTSAITSHLLADSFAAVYALTPEVVIEVAPRLWIKIFLSGHLPGAAGIWLTYGGDQRDYNVVYTGDFYLTNSRLVAGLKLETLRGLKPDVLILEGSFGTNKHPQRRYQEQKLIEQINKAIANSESLLFPVPKVGIGQEILTLLRSHHSCTGRDLDIWLDDRVGEGCNLYLELIPYLPRAIQNFCQHQALFWDQTIPPYIHSLGHSSASTFTKNSTKSSLIFIDQESDWFLGSHWQNLPLRIFIPELETEIITRLHNSAIPFTTYLLADHSDITSTTQLIHNLKPHHLLFIHGQATNLEDLASLEELSNRYKIHCPAIATPLELHLEDTALPYSGELTEIGAEIMLTLPMAITNDQRWLKFADTGLIEAHWQGTDLVIRGISQGELRRSPTQLGTCSTCRFYLEEVCVNVTSPLVGRRVARDATCQGFEQIPTNS